VRPQRLPFEHLTVRGGLASNYVTTLAQDAMGRLWMATSDGISIYDGEQCRTLTKRDGLPSHYVTHLLPAPAGNGMYAIVSGSPVFITHDSVHQLIRRRVARSTFVSSIAALPDGSLWASSSQGLLRITGDTLFHVDGTGHVPAANCMHGDARGRLWMVAPNGVSVYRPDTRTLQPVDTLRGRYKDMYSIRPGPSGSLFVCARDSSVTEFRDGRVRARHRFPGAQPRDLICDEAGTWWIGTSNGIYSAPGPELALARAVRDDFRDNYSGIGINRLLQDRERNIWFGSDGMGAGWLEDRGTQYFVARDMTSEGTMDHEGRLWISSHLGIWEYWHDEGGRWQRRLHARTPSWPAGYCYHIQTTPNGRLYVAFSGSAIAEFTIARRPAAASSLRLRRILAPSAAVPDPDPFCFVVDRRSRIWIKTRSSDVAVMDLTESPRLLRRIARVHPDIRVMFEDRDGSIWIAGYNGVPVQFSGDDPLASEPRRCVALGNISARAFLRDRRGRLWIGTMAGVRYLEDGRWHEITDANGLPNDRVFSLAEGKEGRIWLGTQTGMVTFDPQPRWITPQPELTENPVGDCGILDNGVLWIATAFGLTLHDQRRGVLDTLKAVPYLHAMRVNEQPVRYRDGMRLAADENNCRFEFSIPHLRKSRLVRLEYRFDGSDSTWSAPISERSLTFRALPPGRYSLLVRARNSAGIAGRVPLRLSFVIRPPIWREPWFLAAAMMLVLTAVVYVSRLRVRRLLESERIRTRIAADLHDDIGTGLTRIAMMTDMMQQQARMVPRPADNPPDASFGELETTLQRTGRIARELIEQMSDVVWSLDRRNEGVQQLLDRLRIFAYDLTEARDIALDFEVDESILRARVGSELARSLLLVMKEALNNAVRHAEPSSISVRLHAEGGRLHFRVSDDGRGFDPATHARRSGLQHMEDRIHGCQGTLEVASSTGGGTTVSGTVPLQTGRHRARRKN